MEKKSSYLELITKYFTDFTPKQLYQLSSMQELYKEWNSKINLISRKDLDSLYEKHVLHSLSIAAVFNFTPGTEVIDLGTGGGFPGVPLAIYFPDVKFHLVDSIGKKIKAVNAIAGSLGLENVTAQQTRVEVIRNKKFDFAVSRGVAPLKELWQWSKPLLRHRVQGTKKKEQAPDSYREINQQGSPGLFCLKGGELSQEISECGCKTTVVEILELFQEEFFREKCLLFVPF